MLGAFFRAVVGHPWRVMVLAVAATLAAATGLPGLGFTAAYDAYFSPDNPEWRNFQAIEDKFDRRNNVFLALAPADGDVFTADTLAAVRELTDAAWTLPYASGVTSLTNFHQSFARGDELVVEPLVPPGQLSEAEREATRDRALANKRVAGGLLATDGGVTGVSVVFDLPDARKETAFREVTTAVRALAAQLEADHQGLQVYLTGSVMLNQAMVDSVRWDLTHLYPPFFLLMFLVLAVFFRRATTTLATLGVLAMSVTIAFGLAGWAGIVLNTASLAAAIIILTLAIADSVHVLVGYAGALASGRDKPAAMRESLRINARPVLLTSLTTALGFLAMNFSDSPPFRDLGNIVATGVVDAWGLSITFLPAAMMVLPAPRSGAGRVSGQWLDRLAGFVIARRRLLIVAGLVVIVGLASAIPLNRFGDNYVEFFDESIEFSHDTEFINRELTGMQLIEYPLTAGSDGAAQDPTFLRRVEALAEWFREQPEVRRVVSVTDLVERLNQAMNEGDPAAHRIPDSRALIAQYLLVYEMSLPQGTGINDLISLDKSAVRLAVVLNPIPDQQMRALDTRARDWMRANLPAEMVTPGSSISIMFAAIARHNFTSMLSGTALAFAFIALVMAWAFGSMRLGLVSLVPNLAPLAMGFGVWGLTVGQTGLATSVVASLTLGIVVDDSVHLLSKYRLARVEKGLSPADAVRDAFANVGVALCLTSLVLILGFVLMTLSAFTMTVHMGALTAIIIGLALLADFLFLPPLLLAGDRTDDAGT
ncbi:MAG: MMPL family transporter [Salinisphaeraceae bacterium]